MIAQILAVENAAWLATWKLVVLATSGIFAAMVVVVSIRAVGDLRLLLRDLSAKPPDPDDTP